jgi:filamentous hemagglutinin family protein
LFSKFKFKNSFRILKGGKISLVVTALLSTVSCLSAAPQGGSVIVGDATISTNGCITNINQSSNKASINWDSFNISANESVNFNQPNIDSITLNRVIGNEKSVIDGALNANGQVWLLNSNGVLFGKSASINTSGLLATTANISNSDFLANKYNFTNSSSNSIINEGNIEIVNAGSVVLASKEVINSGKIKAIKGRVHLVGANEYSINLNGNSLINLTVNKSILDAYVSNSGSIIADGGEIYLTTNTIDELLKGVVNNTGVIEANSIDDLLGKVELYAHGGKVEVSGKIEAKDGFVETSGKEFAIDSDTIVKAKTWLIDPTDIVVDDATAYETSLNAGTDVTIETLDAGTEDGDITINDDIDWDTTATLTLDADNDINIFATIDAVDADGPNHGSVVLIYGGEYNFGLNRAGVSSGFSGKINLGDTSSFTDNGTSYTVITTLGAEGSTTGTDLQGMQGDLTTNYVLGADIDATATSGWNVGDHDNDAGTGDAAMGFEPVGTDFTTNAFQGDFNGLGHTISNLMIYNKAKMGAGIFGYTSGSTISNIGVTDANLTTLSHTGALAGVIYLDSHIKNSFSTGAVDAKWSSVGGLVGQVAVDCSVDSSYSTVAVRGSSLYQGGLVGYIVNNSSISKSYATGDVTGYTDGTLSNYAGGLVGIMTDATISDSYATGNALSTYDFAGGLVGSASGTSTISNSYATGTVTCQTSASSDGPEGFLGVLIPNSTITITDSYWDVESSTIGVAGDDNNGAIGKSTADMQARATFGVDGGDWSVTGTDGQYPVLTFGSLDQTWRMSNGQAYVRLVENSSSTYGEVPTLTYALYDASSGGNKLTELSPTGTATWDTVIDDSTNAGDHAVTYVNGLTLNSEVFTLSGAGDAVDHTVDQVALTITADDFTKEYNTNDEALTYNITSGALIGADTLSGDIAREVGEDAGDYAIEQNTLTAGVNYDITFVDGTYTITAIPLTITADDASKSQGGSDPVLTYNITSGALVGADTLSGDISREAGETAGDYVIGQNTLTAGVNYDITFVDGTFTINRVVSSSPAPARPVVVVEPEPEVEEEIEVEEEPEVEVEVEIEPITEEEPQVDTEIVTETTPTTENEVETIAVTEPQVKTEEKTETEKKIEKVNETIASIIPEVETTANIEVPTPPQVKPNSINVEIPQSVDLGFEQGTKVALVSKPVENEPTKKITMSEIVDLQNNSTTTNSNTISANKPNVQEVRVPLSQNSIVMLVNGGVNLPDGVDQEFYVVEERNNEL